MRNQKGFTIVEVVLVLAVLALLCVGPACWHYTVNAWLHHFAKPESFGWMGSILLALFLAPLSIPGALLTWVLLMFL